MSVLDDEALPDALLRGIRIAFEEVELAEHPQRLRRVECIANYARAAERFAESGPGSPVVRSEESHPTKVVDCVRDE